MIDKLYNLYLNINDMISREFPTLNVWMEYIQETDEHFILVDDEKIFQSDAFQDLVTRINLDLLWKNKIFDICFALEKSRSIPKVEFSANTVDDRYQDYNYENKDESFRNQPIDAEKEFYQAA